MVTRAVAVAALLLCTVYCTVHTILFSLGYVLCPRIPGSQPDIAKLEALGDCAPLLCAYPRISNSLRTIGPRRGGRDYDGEHDDGFEWVLAVSMHVLCIVQSGLL